MTVMRNSLPLHVERATPTAHGRAWRAALLAEHRPNLLQHECSCFGEREHRPEEPEHAADGERELEEPLERHTQSDRDMSPEAHEEPPLQCKADEERAAGGAGEEQPGELQQSDRSRQSTLAGDRVAQYLTHEDDAVDEELAQQEPRLHIEGQPGVQHNEGSLAVGCEEGIGRWHLAAT